MPRSIILATEVDASPETVFEAITTKRGLESFWTPDVDATPEAGASLRFGFEDAPADLDMTVSAFDPGRRVEWECGGPWPHWGGTRVEWKIDAGDKTSVVFGQHGWSDDQPESQFGSVALTWAMVMLALKSYVESGKPAPALR